MNTDCQSCGHHVQWISEDEHGNVVEDGCACELEVYLGNFDMRDYHRENCSPAGLARSCPEYKRKPGSFS